MQSRLGRYRLVRHLATGGMGEVYLAEAVGAAGFAKRVVIKTLRGDLAADERLVRRFVEEGRLLEALDHPRIAQILDLGVEQGTTFLAIEYVEGFDLRELLRELAAAGAGRGLGEVPTLCVLVAVAEALDHAQSRPGPDGRPLRIVHHDVTPSNIMVRPDGFVKLVDFGVAAAALRGRMSERALRGKLPYLSPEQAGSGRIDGRADLFSLGLVGLELIGGTHALEVADISALPTAYAALPGRLRSLAERGVGAATIDLLADMVALDRGARPAAALVVADRARERLLHLGESSIERAVAEALAGAFGALVRRKEGFDATLKGLVGARLGPGTPADGTVSLPGLRGFGATAPGADGPELEVTQEGSEAAAPGPVAIRLRKRVVFALLASLLLVGGLGWWLGSRKGPAPLASPAVVPRPESAEPAGPMGAQARDQPMSALGAALAPPAATAIVSPAPPPQSSAPAAGLPEPASPGARPQSPPAVTASRDRADEPLPAGDRSLAGPPEGPEHRSSTRPRHPPATLYFLVLPADAEVRADGQPVAARETGRYRLVLPAGSHRIRVRDRHSGRSDTRTVRLRPGEKRRLRPGFALALP